MTIPSSACRFVLFFLSALLLCAQFRSSTRLVVLHISVLKSNGELVGDLNRNQFTVLEDGKPQPIRVSIERMYPYP